MNPHNPAKRPGAHLVAAELGADDPWELSDRHPLRDPLDIVGRLVATAADEVDDLHGDLARAAQSAIDVLAPLSRGQAPGIRGSYGVLGAAGPRIELLATRRGAAYETLTRAVSAYRRLQSEPAPSAASDTLGQTLDLPAGRPDRSVANDRHPATASSAPAPPRQGPTPQQLKALEEIEHGTVVLRQYDLRRKPHLTGTHTERISYAMLQALEREQWITSENKPLTEGRPISLSPQGVAALQAARSADPRVSAALRRSATTPPAANRTQEAALGIPVGPVVKPSRSR